MVNNSYGHGFPPFRPPSFLSSTLNKRKLIPENFKICFVVYSVWVYRIALFGFWLVCDQKETWEILISHQFFLPSWANGLLGRKPVYFIKSNFVRPSPLNPHVSRAYRLPHTQKFRPKYFYIYFGRHKWSQRTITYVGFPASSQIGESGNTTLIGFTSSSQQRTIVWN